MKATNVKAQEEVHTENEKVEAASKLGTWISVGVVAAVILLTYFVLFGLYMDRV